MSKIVQDIALTGYKGHLKDGCSANLASNSVPIALPPNTKIEFVRPAWENASIFKVMAGSCDWNGVEVVINHDVQLR